MAKKKKSRVQKTRTAKTKQQQQKSKSVRAKGESPFNVYWTKDNFYFLIGGLVLLVIGYYLMSIGPWDSTASLVFSPIVLILAYVIIFPLTILYKKKKASAEIKQEDEEVVSG